MRGSTSAMLAVAAGVLVLGAACARRPNAALEHARAAVQQANQTPEITSNGAVALHEAQQELDRGQHAFDNGQSDAEVEHHAYVAERKIDVARANADQKTAEQQLAQMKERRGEVVAEARTGEVKAAREEAATARAELRRLQEEMASLHPRATDRGVMMTAGNVLFETDRAELKPGAMQQLYPLATFLKQHPDRQVTIEGHTDSTGTAGYNRELSQARAESVRAFLVRNGVPSQQIEAVGYGEEAPVATNATEAGRQQNRRVDIVIAPSTAATAGVGRAPARGESTGGTRAVAPGPDVRPAPGDLPANDDDESD